MALCEANKGGKVEMGYWAIRGLGAPLRMMLEYSGIEYSDFQVDEPGQWFGAKKEEVKKLNPLANLPFLIDGDTCVCQTDAIFLYLGDRASLNGKTTADRLMTVQFLCEVYDLRNRMIELVYPFKEVCRDQGEYDEKMKKHISEGFKGNFAKFEECVQGPYLLGAEMSTADFHLFEMLDQHEILARKLDAGSPLADFPKLTAMHAAVKADDKLKKYFESPKYKLPLNNNIANTYAGDWA